MRLPERLATSVGASHSQSMHEHCDGDEALCLAVREGQLKKALLLLDSSGPRQLEYQNARKEGTCLYWAAARGYTELVRLLLDRGARVDSRTSWKATPLHAAADGNKYDIARLLISWGADVNAQTERRDTPCHMAAYRGHAQCVQLLVEAGCNLDLRNVQGHDVWNEASDPVTLRYLQAVAQFYGRTRPLSEVVVNSPRFPDESCECGKSSECSISSASHSDSRLACRPPHQHPAIPRTSPRTSPSVDTYLPVHQHQHQHQYQHQHQHHLPQQQQQQLHHSPMPTVGLPVQRVPATSRSPVQVEQDENDLSLTLEHPVPPSPTMNFYNIPPFIN